MLYQYSCQLVLSQISIFVLINGKESFVSAEVWSTTKSLSQVFGVLLTAEVCSKRCQEDISCLSSKELSSVISSLNVIGWSSFHSRRHKLVLWHESVTEISIKHPSITVLIISPHKQVHIILMRETANIIETFEDLRRSDPAFAVFINDLESVHQVKVWLAGQSRLGILQFLLHAQLFL